MRILLDTCSFLWFALEDAHLSAVAKDIFSEPSNEIFLSAVSTWEICVKYASGRLHLPEPPMSYIPSRRKQYGLQTLPLDDTCALHLPRLPRLHSDPFDRMLICQSIIHGLAILTPDEAITQYPAHTIW